MSNKYFVIKQSGQVQDIDQYLAAGQGSESFLYFFKREALKEDFSLDASKPEYLKYANKLGFNWEPNADAGIAQYDYRANLVKRLVQDYARSLVKKIGLPLYEVSGSNIFNLSHPVVAAYANMYGDRLYQFKSGENPVLMSYDASYPQFNLSGKYQLSHKQLPFAHFSISDCYRHEQSGECMLLYRQRRFYMPDLHPYFKDVAEAFAWYPKIEEQIVSAAKEVGRKYEVSVEVASPNHWKQYKNEICAIAKRLGQDILVELHDDQKDRYWIINVDYKIIDRLGQSREIGCIQIDIDNAKRLGIKYIDENGHAKHPIIIHSAVPGGIERFIYMLLDNYAESYPLWLSPIQIRLLPVNDSNVSYCQKLVKKYSQKPIRFEIDDRSESVGKKVKLAREELIPFPIVIGEREVLQGSSDFDAAIQAILDNSKDKPYAPADWPVLVSQQVR